MPHTILPALGRIFEAVVQYRGAIQRHSIQTLYTTTVDFLLAIVGGLAAALDRPAQFRSNPTDTSQAGRRRDA